MSDKNIYQRLLEVRKNVEYLRKEASGFKYSYTKESQVISAIRPAMDEQGLFLEIEMLPPTLSPRRDTYRREEFQAVAVDETKKTPDVLQREEHIKEEMAMIGIVFTWVNCDNPAERISKTVYFPCTNYEDPKVIGGLMTYGMRYFLMKSFQIATDELDIDAFQQKELATSTTRKPILDPAEVDAIYDAIGEDKALLKVITDNCPQGKIENLTSDRYPKTMAFIESYKAKKVAQ